MEARLVGEKNEAVEKERKANEAELAKLRGEHDAELERLRVECESRVSLVSEKLANAQIDVDSLKEKLSESLKDYRASIEKLQQASKARLIKMKKKINTCTLALSVIDKGFFGDEESMLGQLIKSVTQPEAKKTTASDLNETGGDATSEQEPAFEFDEASFRGIVEKKRETMMESSKESESVREELARVRDELETAQTKLVRSEAKIKVG